MITMKRVLLDANIYGLMIKNGEAENISKEIGNKKIIVYGNDVIRKELRTVPKHVIFEKRKLRIVLLGLYDRIIKGHSYQTTYLIKNLAEDYIKTFQELFGRVAKKKILNDFLIVACASINELDILVSDDKKTMLSDYSKKVYKIVNELKNYKTPEFLTYNGFKELLIRS